MTKLVVMIGSTIGSSLGWWAGARIGLMSAFIASMIGLGLGIYVARQFAQRYE